MEGNGAPDQNDWLLPAVLVVASIALIAVVAAAFISFRTAPPVDDSLAGQMERWTRCLRSEGVPVPLVESLGDHGFRLTFDTSVLDAEIDHDELRVAFDICLEDAPEPVQTLVGIVDTLANLPLGSEELTGVDGLLFGLLNEGEFRDQAGDVVPFHGSGLEALCEQLDQLDDVMPDIAQELERVCRSGNDV